MKHVWTSLKKILVTGPTLLLITALVFSACNSSSVAPVVNKTLISGFVRNDSGTGLANALVRSRPATASVVTGPTGAYSLEDVSEGVYTVVASKAGYIADSVSVKAAEGKTTKADIVLGTTPPNSAPVQPFDPFPANDAAVDLADPMVLTWKCADPESDSILYTVYLGTSPTMTASDIQASGVSRSEYIKPGLLPGTTYYWQIRANDSKGNSARGPVWSFMTKAEQENALDCDGVGSYVSIPHSSELSLSSGSFTLECWVNAANISRQYPALISKDNTNANLDYCLLIDPSGVFRFITRNLSNDIYGSTYIALDTWYHVAAVLDKESRQVNLYVNGVLERSVMLSGSPVSSTSPLIIGTRINDVSGLMPLGTHEGQIDEIRIWNVARSQAEIKNTMDTPLTPPMAGLVGYWKANESAGTVLRDATGHGHNGTLSSAMKRVKSTVPWK